MPAPKTSVRKASADAKLATELGAPQGWCTRTVQLDAEAHGKVSPATAASRCAGNASSSETFVPLSERHGAVG